MWKVLVAGLPSMFVWSWLGPFQSEPQYPYLLNEEEDMPICNGDSLYQ